MDKEERLLTRSPNDPMYTVLLWKVIGSALVGSAIGLVLSTTITNRFVDSGARNIGPIAQRLEHGQPFHIPPESAVAGLIVQASPACQDPVGRAGMVTGNAKILGTAGDAGHWRTALVRGDGCSETVFLDTSTVEQLANMQGIEQEKERLVLENLTPASVEAAIKP